MTYLLTEARKTAKTRQGQLAPPRAMSDVLSRNHAALRIKSEKKFDAAPICGQPSPKFCSKSQVASHFQNLMKTSINSREKRHSLFPIAVPLRRLLVAMGGFSLALLILSIPTVTAQTNTTARKPNQDFDTSFAPKGIWSDGETTWVAKGGSNAKLYAYNSATKSRDSSQDFTTLSDAGNIDPSGIWSDGTTMWVANSNRDNVDDPGDKIYAYKMSDKSRDASKDFTLASGNFHPTGIWSDKTTMWVADTTADKLYAYKMSDKSRDGDKDIVISNPIGRKSGEWNPFIQGLWSDGTTMWASEFAGRKEDGSPRDTGHKIYAFNLSNGERDASKDFNTLNAAGNRIPRDIWSDGKTMWVTDSQDSKIYAYHALFFAARIPAQEFNTLKAARNTAPHGLSSNGQTLWVTDWSDHKLYAYDLATKQRDPTKDFDTLETAENTGPKGIWSNDTTMWVADWNADKLYAYNLATKQRDSDKDFNTLKAAGNTNPTGIWSNDTTMWVADSEDDKLYAYKMSDKSRDGDKDIVISNPVGRESGEWNPFIQGLWSDGTTMWAADYATGTSLNSKIYAFNLSAKTRDAAKDFETLNAAGNHQPRGLWSDGTTMWVMDDEDDKIYAYRLSDAASLSALTLTSKISLGETTFANRSISLSPAFNGAIARYTASPVPYTSTNLTVSPTKLQPNATVSILPADVDTTTAGHQVNLAVGDNEVTITVTNTDSLPRTRIYTVNIHREFFTSHNLLHDFALVSSNSAPYGLWSDGKTMWVADYGQDKVFAYNWTTKQHDPAKDFALAAVNASPRGLWSDGVTMWVADRDDDKIYAYKMSDKSRDASKDFDTLKDADNVEPRGIWSDGVTMWVSDKTAGKIYAYKMSDKSHDASKDFNKESNPLLQDAGNTSPGGLWSDGVTMWVANSDTNNAKIYAYKLTGECRESGNDFNSLPLVGNHSPGGLWSDDTTMWILDLDDKKLYAYNQPLSANNLLTDLTLSGINIGPFSSHTDNYTNKNSIGYTTTSTTVAATTWEPGAVVSIEPADADAQKDGHQANLAATSDTLIKITVTAENGNTKEYAVTVAKNPFERDENQDFDLSSSLVSDDLSPHGLWSDGTTMWVAVKSNTVGRIYAYKMSDKSRDTSKEFNLASTNSTPRGLWSNGATMWVADRTGGMIFAYNLTNNLPANRRAFDKDFPYDTLNNAENYWPVGLWSDNVATMWIVNSGDNTPRIYAYNLEASRGEDPTKKFDSLPTGGERGGIFPLDIWANGTGTNKTMWVLDWYQTEIYAYKMSNQLRDPDKDFKTLKTAGNENPSGIWSDGTTMWVTDKVDKKIYAYNLPVGNSDLSDDASLSNIALSDGVILNPAFSPHQPIYTAVVDASVTSITITATPNHPASTVSISLTTMSAGGFSGGHQVDLIPGLNFIRVSVTAEDGSTQAYLVAVTRRSAPPPPSGGVSGQSQSPAPRTQPLAAEGRSASSSREWKSRLVSAETLPGGVVRFVLTAPAGEVRLETSSSLLSAEWGLLSGDEIKMIREDNGDGQVRLTVIVPRANEKQRFLRLSPQR